VVDVNASIIRVRCEIELTGDSFEHCSTGTPTPSTSDRER